MPVIVKIITFVGITLTTSERQYRLLFVFNRKEGVMCKRFQGYFNNILNEREEQIDNQY